MTHKITASVVSLALALSACSFDSNEPQERGEAEHLGTVSSPLLGLPTLGLPGLFYFTGLGLGGGGLLGQLVPPGITLVKDTDIVTTDDADGHPALSDFPQVVDLLGISYRKIGAYIDPTRPVVPVPLADGSMGSHPFQRYVQAAPGAVLRKSSGTGADGSAIVPTGMSLRVVVVSYANVPATLSTLPQNVPAMQYGTRVSTASLYKCPGYEPFTQNCVNTGSWMYLNSGRSDYVFATRNAMSFRWDGSATDGYQYFKLNRAGTAYDQVMFAGTAYSFSDVDYKYLQQNYGYASWVPVMADSMPWFFSRP